MERVEIAGIVKAVTPKAALIRAVDFERWFPRKFCRVVGGQLARGEWVCVSVPVWIVEQEPKQEPASPTPSGAVIPADMLRRLIQLCHPDKHGGSKAEAMRVYSRQAKNRQMEIDAAEIRIRAERKIGLLMQEQRESVGLSEGGRPAKTGSQSDPVNQPPTLSESGIDKHLADRARKTAAIPDDEDDCFWCVTK